MKTIKNTLLIFLLTLALAACNSKSSKIEDFNQTLYAPELLRDLTSRAPKDIKAH